MTTNQQRDMNLLDFVGTFLYGEQWQSELARALDMNPRTVRSWVQGRTTMAPETWIKINRLLTKKIGYTDKVVGAMQRKIERLDVAA